MTDLFNNLKNIASDSTVRTVAGTLAVGGFLLNAVFGFGQTAFGLAFQGLTAAAVLGMTAVNAAKKQQQAQSNDQEVPQYYQPDNFYDHQEEQPAKKTSELVQSVLSSFFSVTASCGTVPKKQEEKTEAEKSTLVQTFIPSFYKKVEKVITSCGISSTPKRRRRNANDDMMDMAYGTGTRAGWTPWAKR